MWDVHSTTRLLQEVSRSSRPADVLRLLFGYVGKNLGIHRALLLDDAGLSPPHFRLVLDVRCDQRPVVATANEARIRQGGLLATLLGAGHIQDLRDLSPGASDPSFDLLQGSASLMAFPLFHGGSASGMVVFLDSGSRRRDPPELCALATMSSLLGRVIETQGLADRLEASCSALDAELKAAADVQRWLLPPSTLACAKASVASLYRTALHSGGDYYDVGELPDGRIGVLIADVCGKGAAAAVLMAVLRTIVHDEVDRATLPGPGALLDYADARLRALDLPSRGTFVTAFAGTLDTESGRFTYSSAGHPPPLWLRALERRVTALDIATAVPLGLFGPPRSHEEASVVVDAGDLMLLYTDGITDARSLTGDFFGVEGLERVLRGIPEPVTPGQAIDAIASAVGQFASDGSLVDDQTLLALARNGAPAKWTRAS